MHRLKVIAASGRLWAENYAVDEVCRGNLDIDTFDLTGMCAIASAKLFNDLQMAGFSVKIASNWSHCFVVVDDEYIVDVTATQFGKYQKVCIKEVRHTKGVHYWKQTLVHESSADLRHYQRDAGWISGQVVPPELAEQACR